jgi:hypothetical protein
LIAAAEHLEDQLNEWWVEQLGVPRERFRKTTYDRRPRNVDLTDDYHGVCVVQIQCTYLQQRILGLADAYLASRLDGGHGGTTNEDSLADL